MIDHDGDCVGLGRCIGVAISSDELLPMWIYCVIRSNTTNLYSNQKYLEHFACTPLHGTELEYVSTTAQQRTLVLAEQY